MSKTFNPLVSCIIPVYNAEKYLDQGINSLLAQTHQNLEIILVDDHSTDRSWKMCQRYARKNKNVFAFKNEQNSGGPLRGRERGIREAHGDWITFMDCDDYVLPQYVEHLLQATENGKYDIAVTGHSRLYANGKVEDFLWKDYSQSTSQRLVTFYEHFLQGNFWTDPTDTVGQNLVRADICKRTNLSQYSNTVYAEDTLMALAFLAESVNGVNFTDAHDFVWRQVEGSGSHGGFSSKANKKEFFSACHDIFYATEIYERISMRSPLVSVIVPVYNTERYLDECLDSILTQSYAHIEVIVVNDGSTDRSQKIIDKYRKVDKRIVSIYQDNQGLNMARAAGVAAAHGAYITFVDSDDMVNKNYVRILYENIIRSNVDISICGHVQFTENKPNDFNKAEGFVEINRIIKDRYELFSYYFGPASQVPHVYQMTAWGKLYSASLIKNTNWSLSDYSRHEDNLETLQWYTRAKNGISIASIRLYHYRTNPNSITNTPSLNRTPDGKMINYFEFIAELYKKTKEYLNDPSLDIEILNQFARLNYGHIDSYFKKGWLDIEHINSSTSNAQEIIALYNDHLARSRNELSEKNKELQRITSSNSWRITNYMRKSRLVYKRITEKYKNKTNV